jgi:acetyltransferase EpsM
MKKDQNVIMLGGSGIGMIASSILDRIGGYNMLGFLNDVIPVGAEIGKYKKYPVLGQSEDIHKIIKKYDARVFIAYIGMTKERETTNKLEALGIPQDRLLSIIDPTAIIPKGYCHIGEGSLICPLAQLSADTTLGNNCIMLPNSFVGHDSVLEDYVSIANNACIGANVRVGYGTHVGTNASTREKITIGKYSVVGMGSVILKDVPEGGVIIGNPGKILRVQ